MMKGNHMKNLEAYVNHIREDYRQWMSRCSAADQDSVRDRIRQEMIEEFVSNVRVEEGKKFLKVITGKPGNNVGVHSFIVKKTEGKFVEGDILKAASWNAPAKNFARGNILEKTFGRVRWTGAN